MEFRILGPLEVVDDGRPLELGGLRQRTLLGLLLTRANEVVSADRLIDELWGARPPQAAANALQYHVSRLRKALAPDEPIVTREPGYVVLVGPDDLDLFRFERLVDEAQRSQAELAAPLLREALGLWRGGALSDLAHGSFAQSEILRLDELRLRTLELRLEADLTLGSHVELVGELGALVQEHPLRELLRAQLMRALYGAGRQADALLVYRQTRALLVDELGIEPSPALQELERAILRHDPALAPQGAAWPPITPPRPAIMALVRDESRLDDLLAFAEPLARQPPRELVLARLLAEDADVTAATMMLAEQRLGLVERGVAARVAAYTTADSGNEAVTLATQCDVDLIIADATLQQLEHGGLDDDLLGILARAPCDVGVLTGRGMRSQGPVVAPFGGADHDWSAIEIAAWLAGTLGTTLRLLGTEADVASGRRDASRLLARASLVVQQVIGIATEPVLVPHGETGVVDAASDARLLVIGLSERWRSEGIGHERLSVAARAGVPTLFVRHGLRPSGVAPPDTVTRFTWTLGSQQVETPR